MGSTFYYLTAPETDTSVVDWFAALADPPVIREDHALMWFGPLDVDEAVDPAERPVMTLFPPRRVREDVWTVGEVHCLARGGLFPTVDRASADFGRWLRRHPVVFQQPTARGQVNDWNWFLRGSIQNIAPSIHALPAGEDALRAGVFFVADRDNEATVTAVLKEIDRLA